MTVVNEYFYGARFGSDGVVHRVGSESDIAGKHAHAAVTSSTKTHCLDGPAFESWYKNGQLAKSEWRADGRPHRTDGPARESWHHNGQLEEQEWWVDGEQVPDGENLRTAIDPATPPNRLALMARSDNPGISALAAHNPSCPEEAKTWWALTTRGQ